MPKNRRWKPREMGACYEPEMLGLNRWLNVKADRQTVILMYLNQGSRLALQLGRLRA